MPPPAAASLRAIVQLETVSVACVTAMAPPAKLFCLDTALFVSVLLVMLVVPWVFAMAPPLRAWFDWNTQLVTVSVPRKLEMAPPSAAPLLDRVQPASVSVPWLKMAPPSLPLAPSAALFRNCDPVIVIVPVLLMAPPCPIRYADELAA